VDRFSEALRASKSTGASLELAVAPDSNINHATSLERLGTIFGDFEIDKDSKAKSGIGVAVRGQIYHRFAIADGPNHLLLRASESANLYQDSRFNDLALDLAAGPELHFGSERLNLEAGITERWYGKKPYSRSARIGANFVKPLGRRMQLRLDGAAALVENERNDLEDGRDFSGQLRLERALSPTTGIALTGSALRESLRDPGYSTTSWRTGLLVWRDLGRVTLTGTAEFGRLHSDQRLGLFPNKRKDVYSRLSLGATVRQLSFRGFAPVARLIIERNKSSIAFYDIRRRRLELGLDRAF
jgi:hypothetical protein